MSPYDKREAGAVWNALVSPIRRLGRNQNMFNLFLIVFLIVLGFLLYGKSLSIPYYGNDFQFVFINPSIHNVLDSFTHPVPYTQTYRPIQAAIMQFVQSMHGMNTLPIHILSLLIHILIAIVIFKFMIRQKFSAIQSGIAAIFMLIAPINVMTVAGNDSLHQLLGTLLGILSVMMIIRWEQSTSSMARLLMLVGSVLLFGMAIFSSETAIVYFVPILAVLMYQSIKTKNIIPAVLIMPYLLILLSYGYIYHEMIPQMSGIWQSPAGIGRNTIINFLIISAGSIYPFSTVRLMQLFSDRSWIAMGTLGSTAVALMIVVIAGWLQSIKRSYITGLLLIIMAMTLLLGLFIHPSELIVYTIMPFVAVIIGLAVGTMVERIRVIPSTRLLFGAFVVMVALSCAGSTMQKVRQMGECGEWQQSIMNQLGRLIEQGSDRCIVLINPRERTNQYSVFVQDDFESLVWAQPYLLYRWNYHSPCSFTILREGDVPADACIFRDPDKLRLTLSDGMVVPWPP